MNKRIVIGLLFCSILMFGLYNHYSIPQLIPEDYDCEEHLGFISESTPFLFESQQHYVDRKNVATQKQIEEVCGKW